RRWACGSGSRRPRPRCRRWRTRNQGRANAMSALGQKRTSEHVQSMSPLPPKADIAVLEEYAPHQTAPEAATALNSHLPNIANYKICTVYIVPQQLLRRFVAASAHLNP